jgi:hypothetical protein
MAVVQFGPAVVDCLGVRSGDKNQMSVVVSQDGAPMSLTGATCTAVARKVITDPDPPALTAVVTVTDAAAGALSVRWPGDAVRTLLGTALKWDGVWDLQIATSGQDPVTIAAGKISLEQDVTR